jgi:hypothetical protein
MIPLVPAFGQRGDFALATGGIMIPKTGMTTRRLAHSFIAGVCLGHTARRRKP